ncbi:MAG: hypothetical protein JSV79_07735, partial [Armatimonadota bacterium]
MFGDIFVLMVALLLGGPLVIGYVATRLARRRQGAEAERPMTSGAPRLSVAAFASGLLWLAAVPMILVARDAQDWLVSAGLVPGPPGKTAPIVIATGLALLGFVLGVTSLYQITRQPESLRGKGYAWTGVVLSWCVGLPLIVLGVPRARVSDHVEGRCGQNVAWLVSGVHAYAEDHGGSLPPADSWLEVIGPYLDDEKGP